MSPKKFHLGWFTSFTVDEWDEPFASAGSNPWNGDVYIEFAQALERACFDYIMFADTLLVPESYGGNSRLALKAARQGPEHDPVPLAAVLGSHTRHLGIAVTMSTLGYPPFLLARAAATIDHLARGRFGWNIVTSGEDGAAKNFGLDRLPEHDLRYDVADEYMEVVNQLFASWETDAVVMDRATETYADFTKVKPIDFVGQYFKCRGPLNTAPSPQGRPGLHSGGRVGERTRFRRQARRLGHRHRQRHGGDEGLSRRHPSPSGEVRTQSRRHQGAVRVLAGDGGNRRRGVDGL